MFLGNFVKRLGQVMDVSAIQMKYYYYYYYYDDDDDDDDDHDDNDNDSNNNNTNNISRTRPQSKFTR